MIKRVSIVFAILAVAVVGVMVWQVFQATGEREPVYRGKPLRVWLEKQDAQAIRHIGTNALPVLIQGLHAQDTPFKQMILKWAQKQKLLHFNLKSAAHRQQKALWGYMALRALAVPSLSNIFTNDPSPYARSLATTALMNMGPEARLAAPALFRATKDTDQGVRVNAFWALRRIRPDPHLTIPVLVEGLDDPFPIAQQEAAAALGSYGPEARAAVPALLRTLATNNAASWGQSVFRAVAGSNLKAIDPEAAAKAGVK